MISVIVPAYNESVVLRTLYDRVAAAAATWGVQWELLIIDDGSSDNTFDVCAQIASTDPRLKILSFARNFGHQAALTAGIEHAAGDAAIKLPSQPAFSTPLGTSSPSSTRICRTLPKNCSVS